MSPGRLAFLRYERRDHDIKLEADISDAELRQVLHGLYGRLPAESRQWLCEQLAADDGGLATMSDLAVKVAGGLGAPHVIDVARRKIEEETES